jgi:hypothetical protein
MFNNKNLSIFIFSLAVMAFVVSGCASTVKADEPLVIEPSKGNSTTNPNAEANGNEIGGYGELVDVLKGTGAIVELGEKIQQPFFDATGQIIKVNGADVQVFEFADEATRKAASDQISPVGSSTGTTMITWVDQPNFWAKGQVIVLFVGKDAVTIDLLTTVMGKPITIHE